MPEISEVVTLLVVVRLMVTWTFYPTIRTPNCHAQCLACTTCFTIAQLPPGGQCWIANRGKTAEGVSEPRQRSRCVVRHRLIDDYRVVARCPAVKKLNARLQLILSMATKQK
jgi:hypothetical protein